MAPIAGLAVLLAPAQAKTDTAVLNISISGARNDKGVIRLVVCAANTGFPDCQKNAVRSATLPVHAGKASFRFTEIPAGHYAIGAFHDANANSKLDKFMGIPREGFGFSRNPPLKPRAPRFGEAKLFLSDGQEYQHIKLRHLL